MTSPIVFMKKLKQTIMNKISWRLLFIATFLLGCIKPGYSQNINYDSLNLSIDWKLTSAYISGYIKNAKTNKEDKENGKVILNELKTAPKSVNDLEKILIKSDYSDTYKGFTQKIDSILNFQQYSSVNVILNEIEGYLRKNNKINNEVITEINILKSQNPDKVASDSHNIPNTFNNQIDSKKDMGKFLNYSNLILLVLALFLLFIYFKTLKLKAEIIRLKESFNNKIETLQHNNTFQKPTNLDAFKRVIDELKAEINKLKNQPKITSLIIEDKPKEEDNTKHLFAGIPEDGGYFNIESLNETFKEALNVYKIEFDSKKNDFAKISFVAEGFLLSQCLMLPDSYIMPVCMIENREYPNPKRLETVVPGELELSNNKWIIKTKIKVRYA